MAELRKENLWGMADALRNNIVAYKKYSAAFATLYFLWWR